jgi:hypothetical protein
VSPIRRGVYRRQILRARVGVLALCVVAGLGAGAASAQTTTTTTTGTTAPPVLDLSAKPVTELQTGRPAPQPEPGDLPTVTSPGAPAPARVQDPRIASGSGSAQLQSPQAKRRELHAACSAKPSPVSSMLGLPGTIGGDRTSSIGVLLIVLAICSGLLALFVWRRRRRRGASEPRDLLETASTLIAIIGGVAGLAVQFIPGIGIDRPPAPDALMDVREVHARITHGEYADKTRSAERLSRADRREIGNVVWLELQLEGYRDERLGLQYGLYRPRAGGALVPGTAREIDLKPERQDVETSFLPIWVGYPKEGGFQAQFRLIEAGQVRQMAATGPMRGSQQRYIC